MLFRSVDGHPPQDVFHYSGIDVVTRDNLDAYLAQWKRWESGTAEEPRMNTDDHG